VAGFPEVNVKSLAVLKWKRSMMLLSRATTAEKVMQINDYGGMQLIRLSWISCFEALLFCIDTT